MASASPPLVVRSLAIIGGSSFLESSALAGFLQLQVATPHGAVQLYKAPESVANHGPVYFVNRHVANPDKGKEYSPPHLINYKAVITALKQLVSGRHAQTRKLT